MKFFGGIDVRILDFFHKKGCFNKDNQINVASYKITLSRFEKKYRRYE